MTTLPRHASQQAVRLAILGRMLRYLIFASLLAGVIADGVARFFRTWPAQELAASVTVCAVALAAGLIATYIFRWDRGK